MWCGLRSLEYRCEYRDVAILQGSRLL
jgi:hypothetical protein